MTKLKLTTEEARELYEKCGGNPDKVKTEVESRTEKSAEEKAMTNETTNNN